MHGHSNTSRGRGGTYTPPCRILRRRGYSKPLALPRNREAIAFGVRAHWHRSGTSQAPGMARWPQPPRPRAVGRRSGVRSPGAHRSTRRATPIPQTLRVPRRVSYPWPRPYPRVYRPEDTFCVRTPVRLSCAPPPPPLPPALGTRRWVTWWSYPPSAPPPSPPKGEGLEWPYTIGGGGGTPVCDIPSRCCFFTGPWTVTRSSLVCPPPPPQDQRDRRGKNELYNREHLIPPFLVHRLLGPRLPTPPPPLLILPCHPPFYGSVTRHGHQLKRPGDTEKRG